jgi:predicted Zn-dependent protease
MTAFDELGTEARDAAGVDLDLRTTLELVDLMNAGDKAGAEAKFHEAVVKNPDLPQGWHALTTIAYDKKDWPKVIEYGQKATDLDPTLSTLYGMMADAATKSGDKAKAAEFHKRYE